MFYRIHIRISNMREFSKVNFSTYLLDMVVGYHSLLTSLFVSFFCIFLSSSRFKNFIAVASTSEKVYGFLIMILLCNFPIQVPNFMASATTSSFKCSIYITTLLNMSKQLLRGSFFLCFHKHKLFMLLCQGNICNEPIQNCSTSSSKEET